MASEKGKDARTAAREFRVVSGAHRDAVFVLRDELLVIGADESCDIRLSDAGVAPRHAALVCQGATVAIRPLDGTVAIGGQPGPAAGRATLAPGVDLSLGESGVTLRLEESAQLPAKRAADGKPGRRQWHRPLTLALLAMIVVAGGGLAAQKFTGAQAASAAPPQADMASVQAVLQKLRLERRVTLAATPYGVELGGVLEREAAAKLRGALAQLRTPIVDTILSDEDLVEQVREIFRTHGYHAQLRYAGERRVLVENLDEAHERVQRAAAHVRSDVPQLASLNFTAPGEAQPPERAPPYDGGGTNHISARIDGDTAYLAAAGGARYFVGSQLPGGHTVRRITEKAVQLEREGEISWVRF